MWPWGSAIACTLRRSEQLLHSLQGFNGFKGKRLRPGKRQAWTPIRSHWCVALGCLLAAGWSMPREGLSDVTWQLLHSLQGFKGKRLMPGKRQAWTPMTGCKILRVLRVFKGFKGFKGLRAGKRQAWTPIRSHWCVAWGCLLATGWSMPSECLSDGALGQRYCLHGAAFRAAFAQFAGF